MEGEYITYLPHRQPLHPFNAPALNFTQDSTAKGLYQNLVAEHLKMDFLQHYSATSYAIISLHRRTTNEIDKTVGAQIFLWIESIWSRPVVGRSILYLSRSLRNSQSSRNLAQILRVEVRLEMVYGNDASNVHGTLSTFKKSEWD